MSLKTSIYLSDELRTKLRCPPRGASTAVSTTINRYTALLEPEKKVLSGFFTEGEWKAMQNACNGTIWESWSIRNGVLYNVQDTLDENIVVFGASRKELEKKLSGLTPLAQYALVEILEEYWEKQSLVEERSQFGHMGDAFEEIEQIYNALPRNSRQRSDLKNFAVKLANLNGDWHNLEAYWPDACL
jgi:hypothetical protein